MLKELKDVVELIAALPEKHQKRAAIYLRHLLVSCENEEFMTEEEVRIFNETNERMRRKKFEDSIAEVEKWKKKRKR